MRIISNTSPLIFLAKINCLELLDYYEIVIPSEVKNEILKGKEQEKEDAYVLEQMISTGKIRVKQITIIKTLERANIDLGEKETISLATVENIKNVLLDERKARNIAKMLGLEPHGTIWILFQALKRNKMNKKELENKIFELIEKGYRIKEELLLEILRRIHSEHSSSTNE